MSSTSTQIALTRSARHQKLLNSTNASIAWQRQWIADHGSDLDGYVARYGAADSEIRHGDGGEAIFAADQAELSRLIAVRETLFARMGV